MTTMISRDSQLILRTNDPFSPLKVGSNTSYSLSSQSYFTKNNSVPLSDEILDGVPVIAKSSSEVWEEENKLHSAKSISININSTRGFIGRQVTAVRDDINQVSYAGIIESKSLVLATFRGGELESREILHSGFTQRVHLALNKFNGELFALHASNYGQDICLYLNDNVVPTSSKNIDFPYMVFSQEPIGHIQKTNPEYAVISYKCRDTGKLFYRIMSNGKIGEEIELDCPNCLGGADFAVKDNEIIFRVDAIEEDILVPMLALSKDRGKTIPNFSKIDITAIDDAAVLPEGSGISKDYHGNYHIPITVQKDKSRYLLDILSDEVIVEAMELDSRGFGTVLAVFPKKPGAAANTLGRGNGLTDGTGIIAVGLAKGELYSSNSQSGGISFPPARILNYEMQKIFAFRPTDSCYTRSSEPNMVSMDYFYLESDSIGNTVSQELFFETWDMPLPMPVLLAKSKGSTISVKIIRDGWFEVGKTTFTLSNPAISITAVDIVNEREAIVTCDSNKLRGLTLTFEMKSLFYWHKADADVA